MATYTAMVPNDRTNLANAIPEIWAKDLLVQAEKLMFWKSYEGAQGSGMPIIRKDDLTKSAGDRINIQTLSNLTGAGVTGVNTLVGNEEKMTIGQIYLVPEWLRHAVADTKDTKVKVNYDVRAIAKGRLAYWLQDKLDQSMFTTATTSPTYTIYAGDATSTATLAAGDELSTLTLDRAKFKLRTNKAMPIKTENGQEYFVVVISPNDAYYLRQDSKWINGHQEADVVGSQNAIFTGSMGIWNGMIIREADNVPVAASKSKCVAFGGEAFARGYAQFPGWQEELQDYGFTFGVATDVCYDDTRAVEANTLVIEAYAAAPA